MNSNYIDTGQLQVSLLQENTMMPIKDAIVKITDIDGTVLGETKTDSSGQTELTILPTPAIECSIIECDDRPYALYNLIIIAEGFKTLHIGGVQVISSCQAIQNVAMKPITANGFNVYNYSIQSHTLFGSYPPKIPEESIKDMPPAQGFVVLPKPVIPEFIIVHLGRPHDASAQNMWVYFKDYIKNVACCEIYPTWKRETIKANVLAIVSFTLNRVYTEWYRGKGYDFTITNSTAYDHAFQYGRNIFGEISTIVDDLFATYITKENIAQPLFTQYCDGRRVQCSGLSQWGSQTLGEQGMKAIDILKKYYGYDIYLDTTEKVQGVPKSYNGTVLKLGSVGSDVETIQKQLNRISKNYPAIPKTKVDSVYDEITRDAVKMFQKIFHLPQTGEVNFATWYEISNIYVSVEKLS